MSFHLKWKEEGVIAAGDPQTPLRIHMKPGEKILFEGDARHQARFRTSPFKDADVEELVKFSNESRTALRKGTYRFDVESIGAPSKTQIPNAQGQIDID